MSVRGYSESELRLAVRQERFDLVRERIELVKRLRQIDFRITELEKAENLLDGEF